MTLESDSFTEEKYALYYHPPTFGRLTNVRFQLFADYQRAVHGESGNDISRKGFQRFLCSGLGQGEMTQDGRKRNIGSYHQCYRLDGKLVAVGVLDLLPHCVSSVYLL